MARTVKVFFMPLTELGFLPKRITPGAAGYDLMSPRESTTNKTKDPICTVPKSRAAVEYTLTGVEPHGPTRSV